MKNLTASRVLNYKFRTKKNVQRSKSLANIKKTGNDCQRFRMTVNDFEL